MSPYGKDIHTFMDACEALLQVEIVAADLSEQEGRIIQYYLAALAAKFPALLK